MDMLTGESRNLILPLICFGMRYIGKHVKMVEIGWGRTTERVLGKTVNVLTIFAQFRDSN